MLVSQSRSSSKNTARTIYLDESDSGVTNNMWVYYPKRTLNKSKDIQGIIMNKQASKISINTNYRADNGLSARQVASISRGRYNGTLLSGTDYVDTTNDSIVVYIYVDDVNTANWTIDYSAPTRVFDLPSVDTETLGVLGAIGLVFVSGAIGMLFSSASAGFTAFMFGSILLSLVSIQFLYLTLIAMLYFVLKLVRRVINE